VIGTPRQRLELFIPVCQAVQHAHQKGIIHRDLKPSNVLVALYDDRPVPKVIDFGVAKAAAQTLTDKTLVTGFGALVGTLEYMSPEQAKINQLDIDTRSDIYALGVLLYELLTGSPPFTKKELEKAGMLEMLRLIREQEPSKPSTKLSTADGLPTLAANRGTEPAKLTKLVRGELDWIVMKALEKDRNRRYETANSFALDLQRYLTDEPVRACPPSARYRLRKFARRNRIGLAVAGLVLFFLVLLGSGAGWVVRDRAARRDKLNQEVDTALREASALRERALTLTDRPNQWEAVLAEASSAFKRAEGLAGQDDAALEPAVRERLQALRALLGADEADRTDRRFVARFEEIRLEQTQIRPDVGEHKLEIAYPALKEAFRALYRIDLGATSAEQVMSVLGRRPSAIREQLLAALDHSLAYAPKEEPRAREWLIVVLEAADPDPWRKQARRALAAQDWPSLEKQLEDPTAERQPRTLLSRLALALPRESPTLLKVLQRIQHSHSDDFWANNNLAGVLHHRARPRWDEAIRYYTAALAVRPRHPGTLADLGNAFRGKGDLEAAIAAYRDAVRELPNYGAAHGQLGLALLTKGNIDEAAACFRSAIKYAPKLGCYYFDLGRTLAARQKHDEAEVWYRKALEVNPKSAGLHSDVGIALFQRNKVDEAISCYRKAIELDPKMPGGLNNYAWLLATAADTKVRNPGEAVRLARKAVDLAPYKRSFWNTLGAAHYRAGSWQDAIAALEKSMELRTGGDAFDWFFLAMAYQKLDKKAEARQWYDRALQWMEKNAKGNEELRRFRSEAAELLEIKQK
jgi:tetratricopeptide (TPR) repeat protein